MTAGIVVLLLGLVLVAVGWFLPGWFMERSRRERSGPAEKHQEE